MKELGFQRSRKISSYEGEPMRGKAMAADRAFLKVVDKILFQAMVSPALSG
jgi:hypothetical protein